MKSYSYKTSGTCSREIMFDLDGNTVRNVRFVFGCQGNTKGVASLVEGMDADEAIRRLEGIDCNGRGTSCPDQLARALKKAKNGD